MNLCYRRVCQDLEYVDGKAVCCSAYGSKSSNVQDYNAYLNYSMHCEGSEESSAQCVSEVSDCAYASYASVVCFDGDDYIDESSELVLLFLVQSYFLCLFVVVRLLIVVSV